MKATLVLLLLAVVAICARAVSPHRSYHLATATHVADSSLVVFPSGSMPYAAIELRIAVKEPHRLHTGQSPAWFEIICGDLQVIARKHSQVADNIHDGSSIHLSVYSDTSMIGSCNARAVKPGSNNSYLLEWNPTSDTLRILTGSDKLELCLSLPVKAPGGSQPVTVRITGQATVNMLVTEEKELSREERLAGISPDSLSILTSDRRLMLPDGLYHYLDRSADPAIARPGGRYSLVVAHQPAQPHTHTIYYLSGAEVEASFWKPGMIKGYLKATPFRNQYDLEWMDSHGNPIPGGADSYAVADEVAGTLTLTFPSLDGATLRFARASTPSPIHE